MRKLLIACLLVVAVAAPSYAQEPPDGVAAMIQNATPPAIVPTPAGAMNIFTAIFTAIDTPLMAAVNGIMANVVAYVHPILILALTLELALWAASMMYPSGSGGGFFFSTLAKKLIHGAAALAILDIYISVLAPFMLTDYPSELRVRLES
jgi:hypothetical protein